LLYYNLFGGLPHLNPLPARERRRDFSFEREIFFIIWYLFGFWPLELGIYPIIGSIVKAG
jgi:hypothetical protein